MKTDEKIISDVWKNLLRIYAEKVSAVEDFKDVDEKFIHTFGDRLMRAGIKSLSKDKEGEFALKIAILSDSRNAAKEHCRTARIFGQKRVQIGAVIFILQHYPERLLREYGCMEEMDILRSIICSFPEEIRGMAMEKIAKNLQDKQSFAQSLRDNAEKRR